LRGYRHQFRVGMQVGFLDLVLWSFLAYPVFTHTPNM
jgi:hypothetical protein